MVEVFEKKYWFALSMIFFGILASFYRYQVIIKIDALANLSNRFYFVNFLKLYFKMFMVPNCKVKSVFLYPFIMTSVFILIFWLLTIIHWIILIRGTKSVYYSGLYNFVNSYDKCLGLQSKSDVCIVNKTN